MDSANKREAFRRPRIKPRELQCRTYSGREDEILLLLEFSGQPLLVLSHTMLTQRLNNRMGQSESPA